MTPDLKDQVYYHGRRWDAPMMDDAKELEHLVVSGAHCQLCDEPMLDSTDDVVLFPHLTCHLECLLRSVMGSVEHLEERCLCHGGIYGGADETPDTPQTFRDGARATMAWLLEHNRGRWAEAS